MSGPFSAASRSRATKAVPVAALRGWERNPRRITPGRLEALGRAMEADPDMLWDRPLVARQDGTVLMGNQRLAAANALGWTHIPVRYVELEDEVATLRALRDNQPYGEWEAEELAAILAEIRPQALDLTGFDSQALEKALAAGKYPPIQDRDDEVPAVKPDATTKPGEVIELGPHTLVCGDSTDPATWDGLEPFDALWTDPPYGVGYLSIGRQMNPASKQHDRITGDDLEPALRLLTLALTHAPLVPGAAAYIAHPSKGAHRFALAVIDAGLELRQELVWVKDRFVMGSGDYHYQHEPVIYATKPAEKRPGRMRRNGSWHGPDNATSVFHAPMPRSSEEHPTMKPVELVRPMLENSTRRGDRVVDPFAGSGTTLVAAHLAGRIAHLVEIDPGYCDIIRARYAALVKS